MVIVSNAKNNIDIVKIRQNQNKNFQKSFFRKKIAIFFLFDGKDFFLIKVKMYFEEKNIV